MHVVVGRSRAGHVTARAEGPYDDRVLIFILLGWVPWPLLLALAVVLWLTVVELLEWRPHYTWWSGGPRSSS